MTQGLTYLPLDELAEAEDNPRRISDDRFQQLQYALEHDPQMLEARPIIKDAEKGDVPCGNMRLRAATAVLERIPDGRLAAFVREKGGLPVYVKTFVSDAERREWMLRDNQGYGEWVPDELAALVAAHAAEDADLALLGFDDTGLEELLRLANEDAGAGGADGGGGAGNPSLASRFIVPPFTVLDARSGVWRDRKREWLQMGLQSELGRDGTPKTAYADESSGDPRFYEAKRLVEEQLGRQITTAEFVRDHYSDSRDAESTLASSNVSVFDPVLCEIAYAWHTNPGDMVLDPFAGGSVRGIVAASMGREYVGIDLRAEQVQANIQQAEQLVPGGQPVWLTGDARETAAITVGADGPLVCDFIFTCPPYHDLEVYSDDPDDLSNAPGWLAFSEGWGRAIHGAMGLLANDRFACVVIGDVRSKHGHLQPFLADTITHFAKAGAAHLNTATLVTPVGSVRILAAKQFVASRKLGRTHQYVLTFCKGDPARAAQRLTDLDPERVDAVVDAVPE